MVVCLALKMRAGDLEDFFVKFFLFERLGYKIIYTQVQNFIPCFQKRIGA